MSGRRFTWEGPAATLNVLSRGVGMQIERQMSMQDEERKFRNRIQELGIVSGIKTGQLAPQFEGGQFRGFVQGKPQSVQLEGLLKQAGQLGLEPTIQFDAFGRVKGGNLKRTTSNPSQRANQAALLLNRIQQIEQRNALAPQLAMEGREKAYPGPTMGLLGGYIENKPNILQSLVGTHQRPSAPAIPTTDTSYLRRQYEQLIGGNQTTPQIMGQVGQSSQTINDPIAQRIQQLQQQGVDNQTIAQHLREKGIEPSQYGL